MKLPVILLFLVFVLCSCDSASTDNPPKDIELDLKSVQVVTHNNEFGFNFLEKLLMSESQEKNIMISPLSVSQALSMTLNGANGNTFDEMNEVLGFGGLSLQEINESNYTITNALVNHDSKVNLKIANSIWYRKDIEPKTEFVNNNRSFYNAEVNSFDAQKPDEAKASINNWVKDNTNKKIEKIIDNVKQEDLMFLINAIYFKAEWKTRFKESNTALKSFTLDDGTEKQVQTMMGEVELSYYNEEKYSVIQLPYGYGKFNMIIYLPEERYTTSDIASELVNTDFDALKNQSESEFDVWLPKFEFTYKNELSELLKALGINDAFNASAADFGNLCDYDAFISAVNHSTYIKTDEKGSEAAAATSVSVGITSVGPGEIIKINRSFLFAIVEEDTNAMLFIGKVYDPTIQ